MTDAVTTTDAAPRALPGRVLQVGAVTVLAILAVTAGPYVLDTYTVNILVRSFLYAATALTVDILWGYAGILTFGQAAFFGIGAYAAGMIFTYMDFSAQTAILALLAGMAVSAAVAAITGWISFFHGASPLYVAIVTLALPIIFVQILYSGGTFTGSSSGLVGYSTFDLSVEAWFTITGIGLVLLTVVAWFFLSSDFGRVLIAIRENEQRCTYLGIDTPRVKILLMVIMAMIASLAGYAYAGYTVVVAPEIGSFVFGTELVMWVALGGRGTLIGPVVGTIAIDLISAYLSGNLPFVWKLIVGSVFVLVIVALPQGIFPVLRAGARRLWSALSRRHVPATFTAPTLVESKTGRGSGAGTSAAALQIADLVRSYGSLKVLKGMTFDALGSELLGIIGPNGAGKTTLMRCLSNGYERSGGTVAVFGNDIARTPPHGVVGFGIGRSFQTTSLFETLAVAECLRLARYRQDGARMMSRAATLALPDSARRVITATGLDRQMATEGRHLSHGMKRALELAMVLALEPNVLLLDEPTAGLTKPERTLIGSILTDLVRREGLCILLIEHDLDFVRDISTRIIVLHQGKVLLDGSVAEVVGSELVRSIYAGGRAAPSPPRETAS
jgi:branched-chain amino acid transport system permease protein